MRVMLVSPAGAHRAELERLRDAFDKDPMSHVLDGTHWFPHPMRGGCKSLDANCGKPPQVARHSG